MKKKNIKINQEVNLKSKKIQEIIKFYLFECPVPNTSHKSRTFEELGWKGSSKFLKLRKEMMKVSDNLNGHYYPCKKNELNDKFKIVEKLNRNEEYCVFLRHEKQTIMNSLYMSIRNAIAHGGFYCYKYDNNVYYYFENFYKYKKAAIVLKEKTLLEWIKIVKGVKRYE